MLLDITQEAGENSGSFNLALGGTPSGELVYHLEEGNKMVIEHTEVAETLSGQGAGKQLLEAAVSFARQQNLKILPHCSYAAVMFRRNKEWADVLAE